MKPSVFLIMGTQRSGTTLLSKVLNSHSRVFVQNETRLPRLFRNHRPEDKTILGDLISFMEARVRRHAPEKELAAIGLKDPELTNYIPYLEPVISELKVIVIVRDPRGVVNSYIDNAWGLGTNAYSGSQRWLKEVELQLELCARNPERTMILRYEDLLDGLGARLQAISSFLGINYEPSMLGYYEASSPMSSTRESRNVFTPPNPKMATKWRTDLSKRQIRIVETACSELMDKLGYSKETKPVRLTALETAYYRLHQKVVGELQLQYRLRMARWKARRAMRRKAAA